MNREHRARLSAVQVHPYLSQKKMQRLSKPVSTLGSDVKSKFMAKGYITQQNQIRKSEIYQNSAKAINQTFAHVGELAGIDSVQLTNIEFNQASIRKTRKR